MHMTKQELEEKIEYREGRLFWKKNGMEAGCKSTVYVTIRINKKTVYAHRIAFLLAHGYLPKFIDHIDGNFQNNKIENLREATHAQNHYNRKKPINNTSGIKGVSFHKKSGKWAASIRINGKQTHLGLFEEKQEAGIAYANAANLNYKQYARIA